MKSMTGFGRATASVERHALTVQVSAVNRKSLDLMVNLPRGWDELEADITARVRQVAQRGKIDVRVDFEAARQADGQADRAAVERTLAELRQLSESLALPFNPTPELLWEIVRAVEKADDEVPPLDAGKKAAVLRSVDEALQAFALMRAKEGAALLADFLERMQRLRDHVESIASRAPQVPGTYREQLLARLRQSGLGLDPNDERVLKEVALFADRCDVSEEITRLRSHLEQLAHLLRSDGEVGRKAEFILQEIGREIHTVGSKANDLGVSKTVIEFKNELERVREQVANVE